MKQNITKEQLNELSDKAKKRLCKWWKPREGDFAVTNTGYEGFIGERMDYEDGFSFSFSMAEYPLLSIGQMIDFLDQSYGKSNELLWIDDSGYDHAFGLRSSFDKTFFSLGWKGELCDLLWELVKEFLEV